MLVVAIQGDTAILMDVLNFAEKAARSLGSIREAYEE
jgi:hypothetical protein